MNDLEHTSESLQNARDELAKLRHALAEAESQLANMRDRNAAVRDLADAVKRIVIKEIDSRFSDDTFEDKMRSAVEDIARDMIESASIEIEHAWIRV